MFEHLQERLHGSLRKLSAHGVIRESVLEETLGEIRTTLLEADVSLAAVRELSETVRTRALGHEVLDSITPAQQIVQIVFETLRDLLQGEGALPPFNHGAPPRSVLLVGLQGSGKTTTAAKLGLYLARSEKARVALASLDIYRPAAAEQLRLLAEGSGEERLLCLAQEEGLSPLELARSALDVAARRGVETVILDTAGRTVLDAEMMEEAREIAEAMRPQEILLVADAMTGQDAVRLAAGFLEVVSLSGIILTRADSDARGGAALSMRHVTGCPIRFLATGERLEDWQVFDGESLARTILGMGDLLALVRAAQDRTDAGVADGIARKLRKGKFDLDDMAEQLRGMSGGGFMQTMVDSLPLAMRKRSAGRVPDEGMLIRQLAILSSMTGGERRRPEILQASRRRRIAAGSGVSVAEVNRLLKQYQTMRTLVRRLSKSGDAGLRDFFTSAGGGAGGAGGAGGGPPGGLEDFLGGRRR
ncbi:MAG: signal recognition particle protein Srp54 [Alphaproteobacteria bacterium]